MKPEAKLAHLFAKLDALYARLPPLTCKGLCTIACGPIVLTDLEARRLQLTTHVKPRTVIRLRADGEPHTEKPRQRCIYLKDESRCTAYAVRPLICRAWGTVRALSCMHGCAPASWLGDLEFVAIATAIEKLGGGRQLETDPQGLHVAEQSFGELPPPQRAAAAIDADSERTRSLRALHGGRIVMAVTKDRD